MRSRRSLVIFLSESAERSVAPTVTVPDVAVSRPARQCISVDLPDPDGPMIAVNSPRRNSTDKPSSARTPVSPEPYTFTRLIARQAMPASMDVVIVMYRASGPDGLPTIRLSPQSTLIFVRASAIPDQGGPPPYDELWPTPTCPLG